MANKVTKKPAGSGKWQMSWKNLMISASVVLNIAFIVLFFTMFFTNALDAVQIENGVAKYCSDGSNYLYENSEESIQALRDFTCARGDAKPYFDSAFKIYQIARGISQ
ncbi:MAG TPA: hypothetical protein VLA77_00665 [Candidatus Saccharimonadales bacterium]|nr:hypothetical protein [Candidatus Saccharimonadales bacterium]